MKNNNEYPRFDDIQHMPLRTFNRAVTLLNLKEDLGANAVQEYLNQFEDKDRISMYIMLSFIKEKGRDAAMKASTRGLELVEDV